MHTGGQLCSDVCWKACAWYAILDVGRRIGEFRPAGYITYVLQRPCSPRMAPICVITMYTGRPTTTATLKRQLWNRRRQHAIAICRSFIFPASSNGTCVHKNWRENCGWRRWVGFHIFGFSFRWRAFHCFQAKGEKWERKRGGNFCRRMDFASFCLQFIRLFRCLLVPTPPLVRDEKRLDSFFLLGLCNPLGKTMLNNA